MTKKDFLDNVETWNDLFVACDEVCDTWESPLEDIFLGDYLDDTVDDDISECDYTWREIRDYLEDIEEGHEAYRRDGWLDYVGLTDLDLEDAKADLYEFALENGSFDDEDEEDVTAEPPSTEVKATPFEGSEFDISKLMKEFRDNYSDIQSVTDSEIKVI